ncbi:hypothetical protein HDU83_001382 [Entophlyctis luteolus]|nr:hypothetical protein HDU83_001382 [Entophlyctis luteolus]KAJ3381788.1 hypothetical protein HDU84_004861 [Entophlyctis sp. JEL0112]
MLHTTVKLRSFFLARRAVYVPRMYSTSTGSQNASTNDSESADASSSIVQRLKSSLKDSMKAGNKPRTLVLKSVLSEITYSTKASTGKPIYPHNILSKAIQKREVASEEYRKGGRSDLSEIEDAEIAIIQEFLPKQLSDEELENVAMAVAGDLNLNSMKDVGQVINGIAKTVPPGSVSHVRLPQAALRAVTAKLKARKEV